MASPAEVAAMRRAIAAAHDAIGTTNPNPAVGAALLSPGGELLALASTEVAGGRHAEIVALAEAGERARGATLVVTLEPCRHIGRTGPCTDAIIGAGVARVVFASRDPHPAAAGGAHLLTEAGISVEPGVLEPEARQDLEPWLIAMSRRRPYVTWKYAATLDGRTAAADGTSRWITGREARVDVHRERAGVDAVLVGIGTVLADDTQLTVRDWPCHRQPLRVVVDGHARTPLSAQILDDAAPTVIAVGEDADQRRVDDLVKAGAEVVRLPRRDGRVDLTALLAELFERELILLLLEGGATLAASFVRQQLVDRVVGYHAPALLGAGPPVLADVGVATLAGAPRLRLSEVSPIGSDVRIVATLDRGVG